MKSTVAKMVASLMCAACSAAPAPRSVGVEPGRPFVLRVGEVVQTKDGAWEIGFDGVSADSRCPKGERCVWAGDATVRVWLRKPGGERLSRELHTAPGSPRARGPQVDLRLLRLDPAAVAGRPIAPRDYVATLTLDRDTSDAAPER